ncbi:hypothetical protein HYV58_00200 [Candidatus Peregrinibacteria bacterium]|nr:hypothetical protein [Candidatus Peregrinibacteria bacterium]
MSHYPYCAEGYEPGEKPPQSPASADSLDSEEAVQAAGEKVQPRVAEVLAGEIGHINSNH